MTLPLDLWHDTGVLLFTRTARQDPLTVTAQRKTGLMTKELLWRIILRRGSLGGFLLILRLRARLVSLRRWKC